MSAPHALKRVSVRESLRKTVLLLTKSGIDVQFRGYAPFEEDGETPLIETVEYGADAPPASQQLQEAIDAYSQF